MKPAAFVHALVRLNGQGEVKGVVGVGEVCFHGRWEVEFRKIYVSVVSYGDARWDGEVDGKGKCALPF